MKIIPGLLLCLSAFVSAFAQTAKSSADFKQQIKTFKDRGNYKIEYSKPKDSTEIYINMPYIIYGKKVADGQVRLSGNFRFDGRELKENVEKFELEFISNGYSERFISNRTLIFLVDGVKVGFGEGERKAYTTMPGGSTMHASNRTNSIDYNANATAWENITFTLNRAQLEQVSNGMRVELLLGNFPAVLPDESKQMIKNLLLLSQKK